MRLRGPLVITSVLGVAVLAVSLVAVWTSIDHAKAIRALAVKATIIVEPGIHETFAPPPADAAPALTAAQAWAGLERHAEIPAKTTAIPASTTVQLGLLTLPVGPDCGPECEHGNIVRGGMVYSALNQLAYGYSWSTCPAGSSLPAIRCTEWIFLDAGTGLMIAGVLPRGSIGKDPGLGRHGLVIGFFLMVGGPSPGVRVRLPGRVIATRTTGQRFTDTVNAVGQFQFRLPPGTYQLTGYSPRVRENNAEMRCVATHPVHVRVGQSTRRNVYCSVP